MFAASRWKHSYDSSWPHLQEERAVNLLLISLAMAAADPIEGGGEGNLKCLGCDQDYVEEDFHQAGKNVTRVFGLRNLVESKSVLYEWLLALYIPKFWKARHSHSTKKSWKVEVRSYLTKIRECSKFKWSNSNTHTHMFVRFAASKTCAVHSNKAKDHCPKCSKKVRNVVRQNPDAGIRAWFHGLILRLQSCWVLRRMALHENTVQLLGEPDSTLPYVVCTFKLLHEVSQLDLDWEPESESLRDVFSSLRKATNILRYQQIMTNLSEDDCRLLGSETVGNLVPKVKDEPAADVQKKGNSTQATSGGYFVACVDSLRLCDSCTWFAGLFFNMWVDMKFIFIFDSVMSWWCWW